MTRPIEDLGLLEQLQPFVLSHRANWPHLNLEPLGVKITDTHVFDPAQLRSGRLVEGLLRLDRLTFARQAMGMPRWVLYDCAAFPGVVVGLGQVTSEMSDTLQRAYGVRPNGAFLPLSMWAAIPCARPGAWFGHNLSSANVALPRGERFPRLATLTKALGLAVARATRQYGATQWESPALPLHRRFGPLHLDAAWIPAHTHPGSLSYHLDLDEAAIRGALGPPPARPDQVDMTVDAADTDALHALQLRLEAGQDWSLVGMTDAPDGRTLLLRAPPRLPAA